MRGRKIELANLTQKEKGYLFKCSKILSQINISSTTSKRFPSKKDKKTSYRMYISVNFKNRAHLSIKTRTLQS